MCKFKKDALMKIIDKIKSSKANLFIGITIIGLITAIALDFVDSKFAFHDILVSFHGLVFDLLVFGIILTIYEAISSDKETIKRYKEEINDYRFWQSKEAMFRIRGLIKRLVELKEKELDLSHCFLETDKSFSQYKNMVGWIFSGAFLRESKFMLSDLSNAQFYFTDLTSTTFTQVNLTNCKFGSAILVNTKFKKCDFTNVELDGAYVSDRNWFEKLKTNENSGIDKLVENYEISIEAGDNKGIYKIIRK
jgi:hypothetical protein